jgi:undecaprenyl-diphosphatase
MMRLTLSRGVSLTLWLGAAAFTLGLFVAITHELRERDVDAIDRAVLIAVAHTRTPSLTMIAVDLTGLGSITVVTLFSIVALVVLILLRDRWGAVQLVAASAGAGVLTGISKNFIDRPRPTAVTHLVDVSGYSYPSGHSLSAAALYLTIALIASRHLDSYRSRVLLLGMTFGVVCLVGASRVYLGVHYPSDVVAGVLLGAAWALLLTGGLGFLQRRQA